MTTVHANDTCYIGSLGFGDGDIGHFARTYLAKIAAAVHCGGGRRFLHHGRYTTRLELTRQQRIHILREANDAMRV